VALEEPAAGNLHGGICEGGEPSGQWSTYTRTKLETADRAKENLQPPAFSSTRKIPRAYSAEAGRPVPLCRFGKRELRLPFVEFVNVVTPMPAEAYVFFTQADADIGSNYTKTFPPSVCPLHSRRTDIYMGPHQKKAFDLTELLQLGPWIKAAASAGDDCDADYRGLLRYALQIAAEREIAAGVLAELRELLDAYAPSWYAQDQHERVESALELLQRL
jgi:hypothetical protein